MRTLRIAVRLLPTPLALIVAGCASVTGGRPAGPPQIRTITSVGDKPLPVVAGTPGDSVASGRDAPQRRPDAEGRISGRVLDERGRAVPNAEVRLAVDGAAKGREVRATTDRAGGFTLQGLRPGGSYTVIAEKEDEQGLLAGRAEVQAPDTRVRISLREPGDDRPAAPAARINRVSGRADEDAELEVPEPGDEEPEPPAGVNLEDLPPASEAAGPQENRLTRPLAAQSPSRTGWRRGGEIIPQGEDSSTVAAAALAPVAEPQEDGSDQSPFLDDEERNPLPAAIEPAPAPAAPSRPSRTSTQRSFRPPAARSIPRDAEPRSDEVTEPAPPPRDASRPPADLPEPPPAGWSETSAPTAARTRPSEPEPMRPNSASQAPRQEALVASEPGDSPPQAAPTTRRSPVRPKAVAPVAAPAQPPPVEIPELPADLGTQPDPAPPTSEPGPAELPPAVETPGGIAAPGPSSTSPENLFIETNPAAAPPSEAPETGPAPSSTPPAPAPQPVKSSETPAAAPRPQEDRTPPATSGVLEADLGTFDALAPSEMPPPAPEPKDPTSPAAPESEPADLGPMDPPPAAQAATSPPRRPTWGEMPPPSPTRMGSTRPLGGGRPARGDQAQPAPGEGVRAVCQYDAKHQKIIDFLLPDLQGKPVHFKDLDADLILIDFWGTWCGPCLNSIPHLVELQNKFGAQRLRVVGIAYEQGPVAGRAASVASTVRRLGINYPVLLGQDDGTCPLQAALHVQAYPTMILVDRHGRILWRDQGSTPMTLARLDRVVAAATRPDVVRR